ncbi:MAG: putative addiction module component [Chthoniobacter sp.]|jgi:putative addiction module component (TIGR02574 family)|nr:putative addiction module component [Chthoniobacter sp.]
MILERFPEIQKLSPNERLQLYSELGDTLFVDEPVTDPVVIAELDHRWAEYQRDPSSAKPWSEVRKQLQEKHLIREGE